jgi:hypothetical protein
MTPAFDHAGLKGLGVSNPHRMCVSARGALRSTP